MTTLTCPLLCAPVFYMKPARYFPRKMSTPSVIDNLVYVMDCMLEKEQAQRDGIGFLANMTDWKMSNFSVNYCHKFMMALQSKMTPTRVQLFLIVNPPSWFDSIWKIMKPMLHPEFRRKVHMISFHKMKDFLQPGYENYLPDEVHSGRENTNKVVEEFIAQRKQIESNRLIRLRESRRDMLRPAQSSKTLDY